MPKARYSVIVNGIVQGVGFRPFIHKLAKALGIYGWVKNTSQGVEMDIEGNLSSIEKFLQTLRSSPPALSHITGIEYNEIHGLKGYTEFSILKSQGGDSVKTLVSPDMAVCQDCLDELFDPSDRRFKYPFINCTNCGPRFSIIKSVPYDRASTTMSKFKMCRQCDQEYHDIETRRYHAQPDCCGNCGPQLFLLSKSGNIISSDDPISDVRQCIEGGGIVAVKGLGGIHLACNADDENAVNKLRARKHRCEKPFAVMAANLQAAKEICFVSDDEARILTSPQRPIVLLEKRKESYKWVSENSSMGIMLPYTPVHYLLMESGPRRLIMTSANISELPIITDNDEAVKKLSGIADMFLLNNRDIYTSCDDSLLRVVDGKEYFIRRSRGYVPSPLDVKSHGKKVLACGGEQKASFGFLEDGKFFASQHIGDMKSLEVLERYEKQCSLFENLFDLSPEIIACDMHPDYLSTDYAKSRAKGSGLPLVQVQHHHAHMASCMADNGIDEPCLGLIWDGTGYGTDGTIWGGELLLGDYSGFQRIGKLKTFALPGGDKAVRDIWRIAVSLLTSCTPSGKLHFEGEGLILKMLEADLNCPKTTSMGRLFDGAAAIMGIKKSVTYEGQGAILLEASADKYESNAYPYKIKKQDGILVFDWRPIVNALCEDVLNLNVKINTMCAKFMNSISKAGAKMCVLAREAHNINKVVLSGGVFQNIYLLEHITNELKSNGFEVYRHNRVSTNDEGISLGQAMIAERSLK